MWHRSIRKLAAACLALASWVWLLLKAILDWFGRADILGKFVVPDTQIDKALDWVMSIPGFVPSAIAILFSGIFVWLLMKKPVISDTSVVSVDRMPAHNASSPSAQTDYESVDIGSVIFVKATFLIDKSISTGVVSGRIQVELSNISNIALEFDGTTAGNINGIPFDVNRVPVRGYILPKSTNLLISHRLSGLEPRPSDNPNQPAISGIFEYDIVYKPIVAKRFSRRTSRGFHIDLWHISEKEPHSKSSPIESPVLFYTEHES